ncbi:sensor histidine kinase [Paenibacillus hexagrammi]|uniref:HAMP domain-containing protein n=1 Tax=Paenibacillus hexagrammi TaxID=2908839 RepID=A0ABY3SQP3_9BACL|nr:HAMP domain-containing protein [Paenibacillus sp. YPD9-1]UJF36382.1 HAMP domain-containing protein [Paenibacillus sp. YPD9-1]
MLPIITFGVFLYGWILQTTSEDISKNAVSQIKFYLTDFANEIERLKLLQYGLLEDEDLNEIVFTWKTMDNIGRMDKINMLSKRLSMVQNSSMYIKEVSVHIGPISKSVSSLTGVGQFDAEKYDGIRPVYGAGSQIIDWNDGLYLSALKQSTTEGNRPLFIIDIELDTKKLGEALNQFNTYTGSGTLLISGKSDFVLASGSTVYMKQAALDLVRGLGQASIETSHTYELSGNRYYMANANSKSLNMSIYRFIPEQIIHKPLNKIYAWAWLLAAATFVFIALYAISTYKVIHKPLLLLMRSFKRLENGDLNLVIEHGTKDEFGYLYGRFNQMVDTLRNLINQVYKQKIMAQRAELKQLQSQINPHFLFNSFFILSTMAKNRGLGANRVIYEAAW